MQENDEGIQGEMGEALRARAYSKALWGLRSSGKERACAAERGHTQK